MPAPYQPDLATEDDTKHFDEDIPDEVSSQGYTRTTLLTSRSLWPQQVVRRRMQLKTRCSSMRSTAHTCSRSGRGESSASTPQLSLTIPISLAFKGWTFKAPQKAETRYGHMAHISSGGDSTTSSTETVMPHGAESMAVALQAEEGVGGSRLNNWTGTTRSRALSL